MQVSENAFPSHFLTTELFLQVDHELMFSHGVIEELHEAEAPTLHSQTRRCRHPARTKDAEHTATELALTLTYREMLLKTKTTAVCVCECGFFLYSLTLLHSWSNVRRHQRSRGYLEGSLA